MSAANPGPPPQVTIQRLVEWSDTDAAGHQHHSVILRWVEAAEAELLRRHGVEWLFGRTPRVRHEVNYHARLWFGDATSTRITVERLGRTSMHYSFEVRGPSGLAAEGKMIVAHATPESAVATAWPEKVRAAFGMPAEVTS
jgi:acyl-CoA thioester hydrolase